MIVNFQVCINKRTTRYQIHCFSQMFFLKGIFQDGIQQEWVSIESHSQPVLAGEALGCSMHWVFLVPLFTRHRRTKPKFSVKKNQHKMSSSFKGIRNQKTKLYI